ncbi:ATP-binding protein [Enterococcus raffinosus]|uniref:ATP-binding protein n=1 Tax=Enterococcus avium TaxID=33945 RepID=A0ABD5FEI7_ENTAV|nr:MULTISPECIES: ATP-binding protein [Enterococcus]MDT2484872.1 ATP-binding protein [Enterococcus avium]MDT2511392.1 ATP-binding protein [Enterococcus avium]MDT2516834.1 ATP-binding protein [Enterococcus avium]MDT2530357.1 ATP-binding protein [Enterococcus raffinosus]
MESLGQAMKNIIDKVFITVGSCPDCGAEMYQWREKLSSGEDRCGPTCMICGHKELKRKQDYDTRVMYNESLKKRALNYFKHSSIVPDKTLFEKRLKGYMVTDQETKNALEIAKRAVNEFILGKPVHVVFTGKSGTGKSHLAMSIAWDVLERSNYDKDVLYVNYRELLDQLRFAMNDKEAQRQIQGALMAELKTADLVIIDDIGAELGGNKTSDSSRYNNDTLTGLLEARQNMATVVTTNLTAKELQEAYGERILSRILQNSKGFVVSMKATKDKRLISGIGA